MPSFDGIGGRSESGSGLDESNVLRFCPFSDIHLLFLCATTLKTENPITKLSTSAVMPMIIVEFIKEVVIGFSKPENLFDFLLYMYLNV